MECSNSLTRLTNGASGERVQGTFSIGREVAFHSDQVSVWHFGTPTTVRVTPYTDWFSDYVPGPRCSNLMCIGEMPSFEKNKETEDSFVGLLSSSLWMFKLWIILLWNRITQTCKTGVLTNQSLITLRGPQKGRTIHDIPEGSQMQPHSWGYTGELWGLKGLQTFRI